VLERLAQEVVGLEAYEDRVEQALDGAHRSHRATDVLEQDEPAPRTQHAPGLGDGSPVVGDRAQGERRHDRVEVLVGELERLRIALAQVDCPPEALGTVAGAPSMAGLSSMAVSRTSLR